MAGYSFIRSPDPTIIDLVRKVVEVDQNYVAHLSIGSAKNFQISKGNPNFPEDVEELLSSSTYFITGVSISKKIGNDHVTFFEYKRGSSYFQGSLVESANVFTDAIKLSNENRISGALRVYQAIFDTLDLSSPAAAAAGSQGIFDRSTDLNNRLSETIRELVEHTSNRQKDLDATRKDLEIKAHEQLEESRNALVKEFELKKSELENRLNEIELREKELDDRANTHARRDAQKKLGKLIDDHVSDSLLKKSARSLLWPILASIVFIALASIGAYSEASSISKIYAIFDSAEKTGASKGQGLSDQLLFHHIRLALFSAAIGTFAFIVIKALMNRYRQVSVWERSLYKQRLDIERATLLVEADLESRKISENGLPDILLQSFSRGLFMNSIEAHDNSDHPAEELGGTINALLGQAARLQIDTPGMRVDIDKPGLKRAKNEIGKSTD